MISLTGVLNGSASMADFERLDLRVGRVIEARAFPEARKPAYQLHIDFGAAGMVVGASCCLTGSWLFWPKASV